MNDETHIIINVSAPQNQEEKDKVTKAKIITKLYAGASWAIVSGLISTLPIGIGLGIGSLLPIILGGISLISSGLGAYGIISTTNRYITSNLDSETSNVEGEEKIR